jgi:hypothetical protein
MQSGGLVLALTAVVGVAIAASGSLYWFGVEDIAVFAFIGLMAILACAHFLGRKKPPA